MIILGIESSCDETAAAVVKDGRIILSSVVASSLAIHQKTGGIIPEVAAREQIKCIIPVIEEAILQSGLVESTNSQFPLSRSDKLCLSIIPIDAIAVTYGPGLIGSLLVGIETAKTLAYVWKKPIIPVNHLVGHLYANWLIDQKTEDEKLITDDGRQMPDDRLQTTENARLQAPSAQADGGQGKQKRENRFSVIGFQNQFSAFSLQSSAFSLPKFPALALVVSGGHTDLVLMKDHDQIEWIGGTRDDAAGECFDKCARLLELGYPGGPAISEAAKQFIIHDSSFMIHLPRPMLHDDNFDFSFSGLKTAVLNRVKEQESKRVKVNINEMAFEIQEAICDVLVYKTLKAAEKFKVRSLLLAGGVSANQRLREKFKLSLSRLSRAASRNSSTPSLFVPPAQLCTDNAAYIAACAFYHNQTKPWQEITPDPGLTITGL